MQFVGLWLLPYVRHVTLRKRRRDLTPTHCGPCLCPDVSDDRRHSKVSNDESISVNEDVAWLQVSAVKKACYIVVHVCNTT